MSLLKTTVTAQLPHDFIKSQGNIFAVFGENSQDSGNISYSVRTENGQQFFIKTAGIPDDTRWHLPHIERAALLRNAITLFNSVRHPALPVLCNVIESPHGPLLVYEWRSGELLHATREEREKPTSAYQRFRHLPLSKIVVALDTVFAVHAELAAKDYVAVDFYDGSLLYDFATDRLTLCDLDNYRQGAFTNTMGRMFGSSRYMAPEESIMGATIDARTTVFTMGRLLATFVGDGTLDCIPFRGTDALHTVMCRACQPKPDQRYSSVIALHADWQSALAG